MKYLVTLVMLPILLIGQSNHTVTFSGNSTDFNVAEKYTAFTNVDYYVTFDATYLYLGAFRTGGNTFGDYDHLTFYIDSDPNSTPSAGTGSTTGVNWDSNLPTLAFSANYRIVLRKANLGESFLSSYSGSWSTGSTNGQGWSQYATTTALEVRVPWSDIGNPSNIYLDMYMSYNTGYFGTTSPTYFGSIPITSGITPLGTIETAFPVELSSFSAAVTGKNVKLTWQTATETNNLGFDVERKQSGSAAWSTLGFVKGQGTSNSANSYSYLDNASTAGKYEYRLKQTDRDGKFTYSSTVEAIVGLSPASIELSGNYPNPFNPSTSISFTLGTTGRASLKVYDVLGKEVATVAEGMFNAGERNTFTFNASNLTSGVYYYRLVSNAAVETRTMLLMK